MTAIAERVMPELPSATRIGQGTAVEQSRAIAEVQAAVVVAQQMPRSIRRAIAESQRSCAQTSLAEKAFYSFKRGKDNITGPSVQLARELARCFGNVQYGVTELRRDDAFGQSEMQAWAWDLETNTRSSTTFIVPHRRDTREGVKQLTDMRDIYESNANNGARRLREMIFAILPGWYTEDAVAACYETLNADVGDGESRARAITGVLEGFGKLGITEARLTEKIGAPKERWTPHDITQLRVVYRSVMRNETTVAEEFGVAAERVTAAEITKQAAEKPARQQQRRGRAAAPRNASPAAGHTPPAPAGEAQDPGPAPDETPGSGPAGPGRDEERPPAQASSGQRGIIHKHFERLGYNPDSPDDRQARLRVTAILAQADDLGSSNELDQEQAARVIRWLEKCADGAALEVLLAEGEVSDD